MNFVFSFPSVGISQRAYLMTVSSPGRTNKKKPVTNLFFLSPVRKRKGNEKKEY